MNVPVMTPAPGEVQLRFVGDRIRFSMRAADGQALPLGWRALLRTNLGRASLLWEEIICSHHERSPLNDVSWRDIPMVPVNGGGELDLPLTEVGYFQAKAYAVDSDGRQYWPAGPDVGVSVHPNDYRTANTIYCAFVRQFGASRTQSLSPAEPWQTQIESLDRRGFSVIPPSGKLRELQACLPHVFQNLGCRILHLLPVNPTPTTLARFGRFGSPYACLDLTAVDPALVVFDREKTGIDQFCELTYAAHCLGGRVFLDLAVNHTGWSSKVQEDHPEWCLRSADGRFISPGAWGTVWEDLVELDHRHPPLWEYLAEVFGTWCQRGVDGFRCDAGYMIPLPAWRYIIARVRQEYPDTIFLLEGLGGSWEATEKLLTTGGMQWAYSELFQNYSGREVSTYLDYSLRQSAQRGLWVHYSETHDNDRLAKKGQAWSLMRNRLCALASASGGYGFTAGVEWLATERINVHQSRALAWDNPENLVDPLARLNHLLADHPCFFDGAVLRRLSREDSPVYALRRDSAEGSDRVLALVNTDPDHDQDFLLDPASYRDLGEPHWDLLTGVEVKHRTTDQDQVRFILGPADCYCLSADRQPKGIRGDAYRQARSQAAWALTQASRVASMEQIGVCDWLALAEQVNRSPRDFLSALARLKDGWSGLDNILTVLKGAARKEPLAPGGTATYSPVVLWELIDSRRITLVPPGHWLLIQDADPFAVALRFPGEARSLHVRSIPYHAGHLACFPAPSLTDPNHTSSLEAELHLERFASQPSRAQARVRFLGSPGASLASVLEHSPKHQPDAVPAARELSAEPAKLTGHLLKTPEHARLLAELSECSLVLLANGRGGMARICVDLGKVRSKYDCLLGANLHPTLPVERHILVKRARVWVNADGFIAPLDLQNLAGFDAGPPAKWRFVANAGDGRTVEIHLEADLLDGRNTVVLRFSRPRANGAPRWGRDLPDRCDVRLTVRLDIEDRNFHAETHRNGGAEQHFSSHTQPLEKPAGFHFAPAPDRQLRAYSDCGVYHHEAEWCQDIFFPAEQSRGQVDHGDAYSPGWFELPLAKGDTVTLVVDAELSELGAAATASFVADRQALNRAAIRAARLQKEDGLGQQLALAIPAFVVQRGSGRTVIAGYPWFLDWGRDALICARGLLAAGLRTTVLEVLKTFGRFEQNGTLPNSLFGDNATNRDTSDAPLWYGLVCEEIAEETERTPAPELKTSGQPSSGKKEFSIYETLVDEGGRTIKEVLRNVGVGYCHGTPNGIRLDRASGLIWSPAHFTWMDTNYPAGTPREGYPVEIQVLWIRLLRQLERLQVRPEEEPWGEIARRAELSLRQSFWLEERGYLADCLLAKAGQPAAQATVDRSLRSNYLLAVSLGLITGPAAQRCVEMAARYLVVPGALRSLAPLPVSPPLPILAPDGRLLNQPTEPYQGRYEGDEDTHRKPAYHNGTAWTWTFPGFCEALARAWQFSPESVAAARSYLGSIDQLMSAGCLGHLPEILDGDAPHQPRGCDAQAWAATEALRVWKLLGTEPSP